MKRNNSKKNQLSGLTLLEMLLMGAIIGAVLFITLPKFKTMVHHSREGRTRTNLGDLRGALSIYYSDNFGLYPSDEGTPETRLSSVLVPKYLQKIPIVDMKHLHSGKKSTIQPKFDDGGDWMYTTLDGFVAVNCTHADTKGEPVSNW
jgi:Tfp pilus assembly protein PilE